MKRQTELAILAVLILVMAVAPGAGPMRDLLSTVVGRALALGAVVYVFVQVSQPIGLLLAVQVARCLSGSREGVDETLVEPVETCECDGGFTYNSGTKKCEKPGAESKSPVRCACVPGEEFDVVEKKCKPKTVGEAPPPPAMASAGAGGADLAAVQQAAAMMAASSVPQTTGAAAGATMAAMPPAAAMPPTTERFSPNESSLTRGKQYSSF